MGKNRLEAFTDGVLAIILTIMVLDLKIPGGDRLADLQSLAPVFLGYVLSFMYLAIYWNNHHHLFQLVKHVNGPVLWANVHLLFWLSLIPFTTAWSGTSHFESAPVALYGVVLLMSAIAYYILTRTLLTVHAKDSDLAKALGRDFKGKISAVLYAVAIPLTCLSSPFALFIYFLVAAIWIVPDRRIERVFVSKENQ